MASTSRSKNAKGGRTKKEKEKSSALNPSKWYSDMPGIPDEYFERSENVPITKEEIRAILLSKARLSDGAYVLDVGCGSGAITVEAAIHVTGNGLVIAIDRDEEAVRLTERNLERFGISGYVGVKHGDALKILQKQVKEGYMHTHIIIGGTGGDTADIVRKSAKLLVPGGRMVITTILVETLHAVLDVIGELGWSDVDITQVTISKSRKTSTGTMMLARNPVTIVAMNRPER